MSEATKIGEETPTLHRKVIRQRGGNKSRLFDLQATWRPIDDRVAGRKGIDRGGEAELGSTEIKIRPIVITIRESRVDNQANCRVEQRGKGPIRRRELRLEVAQDLFPDFLLELFAVPSTRWRRHRCRPRRSCRGTRPLGGAVRIPN